MKGVHAYLALFVASVIFFFSFMFKYVIDIVTFEMFLRDLVMFFVIYFLTKRVLKYVEEIYQNYRKIS